MSCCCYRKLFYLQVAKTKFQHPKPSPLCDAKLRENEPKLNQLIECHCMVRLPTFSYNFN